MKRTHLCPQAQDRKLRGREKDYQRIISNQHRILLSIQNKSNGSDNRATSFISIKIIKSNSI